MCLYAMAAALRFLKAKFVIYNLFFLFLSAQTRIFRQNEFGAHKFGIFISLHVFFFPGAVHLNASFPIVERSIEWRWYSKECDFLKYKPK